MIKNYYIFIIKNLFNNISVRYVLINFFNNNLISNFISKKLFYYIFIFSVLILF